MTGSSNQSAAVGVIVVQDITIAIVEVTVVWPVDPGIVELLAHFVRVVCLSDNIRDANMILRCDTLAGGGDGVIIAAGCAGIIRSVDSQGER